jgi:DNA helicase HerA-like ATPase
MLGAVARIFQRGRRKGFRAIAITQRPANVHKRSLAQCNAMVTLRLVAPQDRKAVAEWIRGHADDETGRQVVDSLPKLGRGEGWVWAPEQDVLKRATFPAIKTFDSMRAP